MRQHGGDQAGEPGTGDQTARIESDSARSIAEWTTLAVSIVILLGIVGAMSYLYLRGDDRPPAIVVEHDLGEVWHEGDLYYLPVVVTNEGNRTAENVLVQAELDTGSGSPATADITVTFLAGGEQAEGTFIFADDPSQGELTVHAVSYQEP